MHLAKNSGDSELIGSSRILITRLLSAINSFFSDCIMLGTQQTCLWSELAESPCKVNIKVLFGPSRLQTRRFVVYQKRRFCWREAPKKNSPCCKNEVDRRVREMDVLGWSGLSIKKVIGTPFLTFLSLFLTSAQAVECRLVHSAAATLARSQCMPM